MLTIMDRIEHLRRKVSDLFFEYHDNPIFWLACFLFGVFIFKVVWDALSKEK